MKLHITALLFAAFLIKPVAGFGQSFEIVDPGTQREGISFDLGLTNADDGNGLLTGSYVVVIAGDYSKFRTLSFSSGDATFPDIVVNNIPTSTLNVTIYDGNGDPIETNPIAITVVQDFSGFSFSLDPVGNQVAGVPFDVVITGAKDVDDNDLSGSHLVTISSDNTSEGSGGVLYSDNVSFTAGEATVSDGSVFLIDASLHTLTVDVNGITNSQNTGVTVDPAAASRLVITTQPVSVTGNYDDNAVGLTTINLETQDAYGNPSTSGLNAVQNVVATISSNPGGATLGGTTTVDIQSGTASFTTLTLDEEGTGYTLNFASESPASLDPVTSDGFNVTQLYNLSEFTIASPAPASTQYQNVAFQVELTGGKDNLGNDLSGDINVIVTSDTEGMVFNSGVNFSAGAGSLALALANLGAHTLTVSVDGVDTDETLGLTVNADQSGFTLGDPGSPQYKDVPFNLSITSATGYDGTSLDGNVTVSVVSNHTGTIYNASTTFSTGDATFSISIDSINTHNLTVSVDGISGNELITGLVVDGDDSDFTIEGTSTAAQTAGVNSTIDITGALTTAGANLSGDHNVTVTSDIPGEGTGGVVFNGSVTFTGGVGNVITINLETADIHTLTVAIDGITPTKTHQIDVSAAAASQLVITQQPTGGNGANDDVAVGIGTVTLETQDAFGNNSTSGLSGAQNVSVAIQNDASSGTATLGGTQTLSISTGTTVFDDLTLDLDGNGYVLRFSYTGSPSLTDVDTDAFDMTNVEDQSGFEIVPPGPQVVGVEFYLEITNATDPQGNLLNTANRVLVSCINPQPTTTITNTDYTFVDGSTLIPVTLTTAVEHTFEVFVDLSNETTISIVVAEDGSGMDLALDPAGTQTAGTAFDIDITNAMDATGTVLDGNRVVTIASSNTNEGTSGTLFSGNLSFTAGVASRSVTLTEAVTQDLYVTIDWVKDPDTIYNVNVDPNTATEFLITQQPSATVDGANDNTALSVGTVILQTQDSWGNISTDGLAGAQTVDVIVTGSPAGVTLGGTTTGVDISSGTASFADLTLDKNGDYTLSFTYNGSAPTFDPNPVISNTISMTNVEDLSAFDVEAEAGTKYGGIPFNLLISNALDVTGTSLDGSVNVTVSSSLDGEVYNRATTFSAGAATAAITLTAATHDLTITVAGVTNTVQITGLVVVADQSDFTLALDPVGGPFYAYEPFILNITGAIDLDGASLGGEINVTVTSNQADGEVYNATATFTGGTASIDLTLLAVATHTLTVDVVGVTNDKTIDLVVGDNTSGFTLALSAAGDKTAGTPFGLSVTSATGLSGALLTGAYNVTVTSSNTDEGTTGEIFNEAVTFDAAGDADFNVTLTKAEVQTLTVEINGITDPEVVEVTVVAADVSKLVITQQPTGGAGAQNDSPTSTGTVVVGTFDQYDNPSTAGMSGTQQVTVSIGTNASYNNYASLGGTTTLNISGGTATFSDLTLDQDGTGYTLSFSYSGDPALGAVESDPFNMTGVNAYVITLVDDALNPLNGLNPLVFPDSTVGYDPITAEAITVTRTQAGVIQTLATALGGTNAGSFTLTQPLLTTLDDGNTSTTFTVKPNDGLAVGTYSATVTVTADNGVNEQFDISFEVLAPAAITLDADDPTLFTTETEGYSQIADLTVTITNSGGGEITNLSVALSGDNPTAFVTSTPTPTDIASTATSTFTLRPANGLTPGTYSAVVTVNNDEGVPESFGVSFEVIAYTYLIDLDPSGNIDFGNVSEGYTPAPAAETITITRTGTGTIANLAVALSGGGSSDFDVTQPAATTLDGSPNTTDFTVQPKTGLAAGTYTETVTVSADNMTNVTFDVTLRVSGNVSWTGSTNSDWHTAGNWSSASVPDEFSFITIASSSNDPVVTNVNITVGSLVIASGAELTITSARRLTIASGGQLTIQPGGMLTSVGTLVNNAGAGGLVIESDGTTSGSLIQNSSGVSATFERHMTANTWHTLSSPVSGSIQSFILNPDNNIPSKEGGTIFGMGPYDEGEGRWLYFTNATYGVSFTPGKAYITRKEAGADDFVTLAGTLNRGTYNMSASRTRNGWNGIGNPYPSSIAFNNATSLTNFIDVNADQFDPARAAGYFWNGTDYTIINNTSGATYLQPGQGFIVQAKEGGGTFSFSTSQQAHNGGSASFYKKSTALWDEVTLNVATAMDTASTRILFRDDMTRGLDITYDAGIFGTDTVFQLYTRLVEDSEVGFAIQCLPGIETDPMVIPVGLNYSDGGLVTFTADIGSLPPGYIAVLEDRSLEVFTDLTGYGAKYEVQVNEETTGIGRFYLHAVADPTSIDLQTEEEIMTYAVRDEIYIKGQVSGDARAHLFDIMGRKLGDYRLEPSEINILRPELKEGIYIIRIEDRGIIKTERLYLAR